MDAPDNSHESRQVKIATFKTFRESFLREITLPEFGEDIDSIKENSRSPAAKELEESGAARIFSNDGFLHFAHGLLRKYSLLLEEQRKVPQLSAHIGLSIKRFRDAQKTLQRLQKEIKSLHQRLLKILGWDRQEHLVKALKELEIVEDTLASIERAEASHIHPELRKKHDKTVGEKLRYSVSRFKSLDPRINYELDSLGKKAPLQWLIEAIDAGLGRRCGRAQITLSSMTRYRIIAEIVVSGGLPEISASTIKQHFVEKRRRTQRSARNSQAT